MEQVSDKGYIAKKEKGSGLYQELHLEGIKLLQELCGSTWTDYNEHDPGVTILENIAYTLTNLAYKTDFPIQDILTESKGAELATGDNGYFIPSEILTTSPVTINDYRKLIVDRIPLVKNAWVRVARRHIKNAVAYNAASLKGLYEIELQLSDNAEDSDRIVREVHQLFHENRNLCEGLLEIKVLENVNYQLRLHLTLEPGISGEEVLAKIYFKLNDHLSHKIKFYSLWDYREELKTTATSGNRNTKDLNKIFNGPMLENGFIPDHQFNERTKVIDHSELSDLIGQEEGVVSVECFELLTVNGKEIKVVLSESIPMLNVNSNKVPQISENNVGGDFKYTIEGIPFSPDIHKIQYHLSYITAKNYGSFKAVSQAMNEVEIPKGEDRQLSAYFSLREQFPSVYGIGEFGLPSNLPDERYSQAKQLKGYLLPIDQLLKNYLAQLTNVYTLYDVESGPDRSYYFEPLEDSNKLEELLVTGGADSKNEINMRWMEVLERLNRAQDKSALERLHAIADNLLARFGEVVQRNMLRNIETSTYGKNAASPQTDFKILENKRRLISNYAELSYGRFRGMNFSNSATEADDSQPQPRKRSGLVEKIGMILGIRNLTLRSISESILDSDIKVVPYKAKEETFEVIYEKDDEIVDIEGVIVEPDDSGKTFKYRGYSGTIFNDVLRMGIKRENYKIENKNSHFETTLAEGESNKVVVLRTKSEKNANRIIDKTISRLKKLGESCEGLYLLEHNQLTPPPEHKAFGYAFSLELECGTKIHFEQAELHSLIMRNEYLEILLQGFNLEPHLEIEIEPVKIEDYFAIEISKKTASSKLKLAQCTVRYGSMAEARKSIEAIDQLFECDMVDSSVKKLKNYVYYGKSKIAEDFFSFRMSFVLPSWPARFQQLSFKTKFKSLVLENAPAHIGFDIFWVDYPDLSNFESDYYKWLESTGDERAMNAFALVRKLLDFQKHYSQ